MHLPLSSTVRTSDTQSIHSNYFILTVIPAIHDTSIQTTSFSQLSLYILGPYCGGRSPGQVVVPGDLAYVYFRSDASESHTGFQLQWTVMCK